MSLEENKAVVRRFYDEFFNQGNLSIVDELHSAYFQHSDSGSADAGGGPEGYKRRNSVFLRSFPDRHVTMRATQTGDLPGIPATGKRVVVTATVISRIRNGKIVEEWEDWNALWYA